MKRTIKILLISATCLLIFGILLMAGSAAIIRTTGQGWGAPHEQATTQRAELTSIQTLSLTLVSEPIHILRGGDSVVIEWSEMYDNQYTLNKVEGQSLSLSRTSQDWRWNVFGLRNLFFGVDRASNRPVTVRIPEGMNLRAIDLRGANIVATIDDIEALDVNISGANARATLTDITARDLEISGANIYAALTNVYASTVTISGANARSTLNNAEAHNISISGANARATLNHTDASAITLSGANVIAQLNNISANSVEVLGANANATMTLQSIDDWGFNVSGTRASLRIDGQRATGFRGSNTVTVSGANARLDVQTR